MDASAGRDSFTRSAGICRYRNSIWISVSIEVSLIQMRSLNRSTSLLESIFDCAHLRNPFRQPFGPICEVAMAKKRKRGGQDDESDKPATRRLSEPSNAKHYEQKEDLEWDIQK